MTIQNPKSKIQNRIDAIFHDLRARKQAALMPFITAGYPSMAVTERVIPALESAGASIVEIGFPFSDPIADGPVIAASMYEALQSGVTPRRVFEMIQRVRPTTSMGLVAMVSDSIITRIGPEPFVIAVAEAGFDGLIVPDIDLDAAKPLAGLAKMNHLTLTLLIAPTSTPERIKAIADLCTGFIYLLARVGVTGESQEINLTNLRERVELVRRHSDLPIAVGFGISQPAHVAAVAQVADAAIIGSALVRRMGAAANGDAVEAARLFVVELARTAARSR